MCVDPFVRRCFSSSFKRATRTFLSSLFKTRLRFVLSVNRWSLRFFVFVSFYCGFAVLVDCSRCCGFVVAKATEIYPGLINHRWHCQKFVTDEQVKTRSSQQFSQGSSLFRSESFLTFRELAFRLYVKFVENQLSYEVEYFKQLGHLISK